MKSKLSILFLVLALFSCTNEVEVIKEVEVIVDKNPLPDSLSMFFASSENVQKYNELITMFKQNYYGDKPDFIIVSYGKSNNASNLQCPTGLTKNHICFQFFKNNTRYNFVAKPIKKFDSPEDEWMPSSLEQINVIFNPYFYNDNQFVYDIINL